MIAKGSSRNFHSGKFGNVQQGGFVLDMGEIIGAGHLFLVLAVCNAQPCQTKASILLEGEIDGLGKSKVHRSRLLGSSSSENWPSATGCRQASAVVIEVSSASLSSATYAYPSGPNSVSRGSGCSPHYLAILGGNSCHTGHDDQAADSGPRDQDEAVSDGERERLLSDLQAEDLARSSGGGRQARGLARHPCCQAVQPLISRRLAKADSETKNIGVELFARWE